MKTLCDQSVSDEEHAWALAEFPDDDDEVRLLRVFMHRVRANVAFLETIPAGVDDATLSEAWKTTREIVDRLEVVIAYRESLGISPQQVN